jgi:hypothetical protein
MRAAMRAATAAVRPSTSKRGFISAMSATRLAAGADRVDQRLEHVEPDAARRRADAGGNGAWQRQDKLR